MASWIWRSVAVTLALAQPAWAAPGAESEIAAESPTSGSEVEELEAAAVDLNPVVEPGAVPEAAAEADATEAVRWHNDLGIDLALRLEAFVTQGRTFAVDLAEGRADGWHGLNAGVDLELGYAPPLPEPWRIFSVVAGLGYTPFIGSGLASYTQYEAGEAGVVPVTTSYRYDWSVHMVPVNLGLRVQLPLELFLPALPLGAEVEGGFAGGLAMASSTLTREGADAPFASDVADSDFGLGYYLGALVRVPLPPALGSVVAGYRYSAVRLDFHRPDFNATWGDLGGHHIMAGYRLEL